MVLKKGCCRKVHMRENMWKFLVGTLFYLIVSQPTNFSSNKGSGNEIQTSSVSFLKFKKWYRVRNIHHEIFNDSCCIILRSICYFPCSLRGRRSFGRRRRAKVAGTKFYGGKWIVFRCICNIFFLNTAQMFCTFRMCRLPPFHQRLSWMKSRVKWSVHPIR